MKTTTPNIVIQNPTVRKIANTVIGAALIVLPVLAIIQSETAVDFSAWLPATTSVTAFLAGAFGIAVTVPNISTKPEGEDTGAEPVEVFNLPEGDETGDIADDEEPDVEEGLSDIEDSDTLPAQDYDTQGFPAVRGKHAK